MQAWRSPRAWAVLALTFAAATASWHLLEKPVLARKGRWARPSGPTSGPEESEPIPRQGSQR